MGRGPERGFLNSRGLSPRRWLAMFPPQFLPILRTPPLLLLSHRTVQGPDAIGDLDQDGPRETGGRERETERGREKEKQLRNSHRDKTREKEGWRWGVCVKVPVGAHSSHRRGNLSPWKPDVKGTAAVDGQGRLVQRQRGPWRRQAAGPRKRKERRWGDQERRG